MHTKLLNVYFVIHVDIATMDEITNKEEEWIGSGGNVNSGFKMYLVP